MFRYQTLLIVALIGIGATGAVIFNWPTSETEEPRVNPTEEVSASRAENTSNASLPALDRIVEESVAQPAPSALDNADAASQQDADNAIEGGPGLTVALDSDHITRGDQYLLVGNYVAAWRDYTQATNQLKGVAPSPLLLRLAISAEQSGNRREAANLYQKVVKHSLQQPTTRLLGLSGLARIWIADGRHAQALELLTEMYLRHGTTNDVPDEVRYQIVYQLSNVVSKMFLSTQEINYGDARRTEFLWCEPDIERMLELALTSEDSTSNPTNQDAFRIKILQRPNSQITLIAVDASTPLVPATELVKKIATEAQLSFEISPRAHAVLSGRSARLALSGLPLSTVIDSLVVPLNLIWHQENDVVRLQHVDEVPDMISDFRFQHAERSLRRIELSMKRNLRRDSALLHRGNISLINGDYVSAGDRYRELNALQPNGDLLAKLSYNAAMLDLVENRTDDAISQLYYSVDQSLDHAIQAASYSRIGHLELAKGNLDGAVYAVSRGLALASEGSVRQDLVLTLARSYLLKNETFSANKVLFDNADTIVDSDAQRLAAVFGAYARYLGTPPVEGMQNQATRLVIALSAIEPNDTENFVDALLIGRAFFEVGFTSRSTDLMQLAQSKANEDYWSGRIAFEVGTHLYRGGDLDAAAEVFSELSDKPNNADGMATRAKLTLAEINLARDQPEPCLELCKKLWELPLEHSQKIKTLSLMGKSYQQLGRHHAAAVCFSGMVPFEGENKTNVEQSNFSSRRRAP